MHKDWPLFIPQRDRTQYYSHREYYRFIFKESNMCILAMSKIFLKLRFITALCSALARKQQNSQSLFFLHWSKAPFRPRSLTLGASGSLCAQQVTTLPSASI